MIEFADADDFIKDFETIYSKKIFRIPYTTKEGVRKTILMCKCWHTFVSMPYMSLGVFESKPTDRLVAPFMLFETEEGNIISTSKKPWEIRDTLAHSPYICSDKLFIWKDLTTQNDIMQLYSSNIRRKIRKAYRDGIEIKNGISKRLIRDFYHAYSLSMEEKLSIPIGRQIIKNAVKTGKTIVFVAYKGNKIVGGSTLNDMHNGVMSNELLATLSKYNKHYTSYALHHAMMTVAQQKNSVYYSFGLIRRNSTVHEYQRHYKGEEIPLYWSYSRKIKHVKDNKQLRWIWQKLPYVVKKQIGLFVPRYIY